MSTILTPPTTKLCCLCGDPLPIDRKSHRCKPCHARYVRQLRAKKRTRSLRSFTAAVARCPESEEWRIRALVAEMCRRFGGVANLAGAIAEQISIAMEVSPGGGVMVRYCTALLRLMAIAEENMPEAHEAEMKTKVSELIEREALRLIQTEPELVFSLAEDLGWSVSPPVEQLS